MGKLVFGGVLLLVAFFMMVARSGASGRQSPGLLRLFALAFTTLGALVVLAALIVVIEPGEVGVKHAFGTVDHAAAAARHSPRDALVVGGALLHPRGAVPPGRRTGRRRSRRSPASRWG